MTVIVATRKAIYSDSRCTTGSTHFPTRKVYRFKGELIGVSGENRSIEKFMRWYRGGRRGMLDFNEAKDGGDSFSVIVLNRRGIWVYDDCSEPDEVLTRDWHAIGTGGAVAIGALAMGADARRAVEIACEHADGCGLPVQEFAL